MRQAFPEMWVSKQADGADPWKVEGKAILRTDLDPISLRGSCYCPSSTRRPRGSQKRKWPMNPL